MILFITAVILSTIALLATLIGICAIAIQYALRKEPMEETEE